jgi:hypothetical protein
VQSTISNPEFAVSFVAKWLVIPAVLVSFAAAAQDKTEHVTFVTHAAFFSKETKQPKPLDPQVFVHDAAAPGAVGPQGIEHIAGVRPAFIDSDKKSTPVLTAKGEALGFTLGQWLGAKGSATIAPAADGKAKITASFSGLHPNGHYSLFENHFDQKPIGFTPLDGMGERNNFVADKSGGAKITVTAPSTPTKVNAILLVYHSDGTDHGKERGAIGVNAHHQLIAPIQ